MSDNNKLNATLIVNRHVLLSMITEALYESVFPKIEKLLPGISCCVYYEYGMEICGTPYRDYDIGVVLNWAHDTCSQELIAIDVTPDLYIKCFIPEPAEPTSATDRAPNIEITSLAEAASANIGKVTHLLTYITGDGWEMITGAITARLSDLISSASHDRAAQHYARRCAQWKEDHGTVN